MIYSKFNEKVIIEGIKTGNEEAYKAIYMHAYKPLCVYILSLTSNRNMAEDIVQEAFLKLWANRKSLQIKKSLNSYLYRLAYHEFVNVYRKNKKINDTLETFRLESLSELLEIDEDRFQHKLQGVKNAIDTLPPRRKEIFVLNKQQGMSYKDIATKLGITRKTVENQIGKALISIRKKMNSNLLPLLFLLQKQLKSRE